MNAVDVEHLRVEHDGRAVVAIEALSIVERSFTVVSGPSGAGKTTLLRALAGLARPSSGRVSLFGTLASEGRQLLVPPEARRIGFVFQGGALWPHLSVRKTLEFVLSCRGVARADRGRRVGELVELVELVGLEARRPGELSGGEGQRLALARALAVDPRLLLLDEPFGQLDAQLRTSLAARLAEVHHRMGLSTVLVTHDPAEVGAHATGRLTMAAGSIVSHSEGTP